MNGIINVLKPPGMTSHDVVSFIRKRIGTKRVGHTGTLDPEAAGVLVICVGKATKAVQYLVNDDKIYRANIKFGIITDTQDKYGTIIKKSEVDDINSQDLQCILSKFVGKIQQTPPLYSALKHKGKRLYEYARQGQSVQVNSREVEIYDIKFIDKVCKDEFIIDILCSKGTYIRTLCNDIGKYSNFGAHMTQLIRLQSGIFSICNAFTLEEIETLAKKDKKSDYLIKVDELFKEYKRIDIKETASKSALNGNPIFSIGLVDDIENIKLKTEVGLYLSGVFIGIGQIEYDSKNNRNYVKIKTLFV